VAVFDAEQYLRLAGEAMLLDHRGGEGGPWESPLDSAGHALVAVGALAAGRAQAIVDDYHLARCCRSGEEPYFRRHRQLMARQAGLAGPAAAAPAELGRFRAVACGRVIEQPWGELRISYAVLSDEATVLHVTMRPAQPAPPRGPVRRRHAMARMPGPPGPGGWAGFAPGVHTVGPGLPGQLTLTDDQGTTASAMFSGGGSDTQWTGEFEARPPLAVDAAWIDMLGGRIGLPDDPGAGIEVRVEPVAEPDPGRRYLQARLAKVLQAHEPDALDATIEVLVAAGALAAGDPVIGDARAVLQRHSHGPGSGLAGRRLPEPWRSLLAASGRSTGREGLVVVGAATPRFGGVAAVVLAVETAADEFTVAVELTPSLPHWHAGLSRVDEPILVWWAEDDRGGHYLGQPSGWHSGPERCGGQVGFWPALDPAATRLDIMPTTVTERAVIRVPLNWAAAR
jgi:hypothetical protein